jgi:hypothetical protein
MRSVRLAVMLPAFALGCVDPFQGCARNRSIDFLAIVFDSVKFVTRGNVTVNLLEEERVDPPGPGVANLSVGVTDSALRATITTVRITDSLGADIVAPLVPTGTSRALGRSYTLPESDSVRKKLDALPNIELAMSDPAFPSFKKKLTLMSANFWKYRWCT